MDAFNKINWNWIYYFYEVARNSSMTEASKKIGVSTSTISEQIRRLEESIHIKLFKRNVRKLELTEEGMIIYLYAKEMFEHGNKILDNINTSISDNGGYPVNIGVQDNNMSFCSYHLVSKYFDIYLPYGVVNTEKKNNIDQIVHDLLSSNIEIGITNEEPNNSNIDFAYMGRVEVLFACSKSVYNKFSNKHDIIKYFPFVENCEDLSFNKKIREYLSSMNCFPNEILNIASLYLTIDLVRKSRCVSIFPEVIIKKASPYFEITSFSFSKPLFLDFYLLWVKGKEKMLAIRKMRELVKEMNINDFLIDYKYDPDLQIKIAQVPHLKKDK